MKKLYCYKISGFFYNFKDFSLDFIEDGVTIIPYELEKHDLKFYVYPKFVQYNDNVFLAPKKSTDKVTEEWFPIAGNPRQRVKVKYIPVKQFINTLLNAKNSDKYVYIGDYYSFIERPWHEQRLQEQRLQPEFFMPIKQFILNCFIQFKKITAHPKYPDKILFEFNENIQNIKRNSKFRNFSFIVEFNGELFSYSLSTHFGIILKAIIKGFNQDIYVYKYKKISEITDSDDIEQLVNNKFLYDFFVMDKENKTKRKILTKYLKPLY